ncbi:unnamed protein product [Amoebophrya sp. A120]|nr:unnamed protein product [Amoebophrya sp. A120]|eukprot:GSA120T00006201001.1
MRKGNEGEHMLTEAADKALPLLQQGGENTLNAVNKLVQQGPKGVSKLAFLCGLITALVGLLEVVLTVLSPLSIIFRPFHLVLSLYIIFFGLTAVILECDADWLATMKYWPLVQFYVPDAIEKLGEYQKIVFHRANILTDVYGRAAFYGFVGILCGTQCFLCPFFLVGVLNVCLAILLTYLQREEGAPDLSYESMRTQFFHQLENVQTVAAKFQQQKAQEGQYDKTPGCETFPTKAPRTLFAQREEDANYFLWTYFSSNHHTVHARRDQCVTFARLV